LKVGVVNWWNTYPPEKIDGVMISDHLYPWQTEVRRRVLKAVKEDESSPIVFPESWRARVVAGLESDTPLTGISNLFEENESLPKWVKTEYLAGVFRSDTKVVKHALEVESAIDPDLLMVFLPGIDRVSHALWGSIEPPELYPEHLRLSGSAREAAAEALFGYYRYTDALIGRLCERYGENDLIMVVSDHGFEAGVSRVGGTGIHESRHARDGIIGQQGVGQERTDVGERRDPDDPRVARSPGSFGHGRSSCSVPRGGGAARDSDARHDIHRVRRGALTRSRGRDRGAAAPTWIYRVTAVTHRTAAPAVATSMPS
jgi:hypothetical protein